MPHGRAMKSNTPRTPTHTPQSRHPRAVTPPLFRHPARSCPLSFVIPAKAGIQLAHAARWIPAFAGMTKERPASSNGYPCTPQEEGARGMPMTLTLGDEVRWKSHAGTAHGKVVRKLDNPTTIEGHKVAASPENPQLLVTTDEGKSAAHKASALHRD
jgi:hypothetical protein